MIRPALIALFVLPFVLYAAFLLATRAGILRPKTWAGWVKPVALIALVAVAAAVAVVFWKLVQFSGAPPGSTYVPAHIEDGKFVPGSTK